MTTGTSCNTKKFCNSVQSLPSTKLSYTANQFLATWQLFRIWRFVICSSNLPSCKTEDNLFLVFDCLTAIFLPSPRSPQIISQVLFPKIIFHTFLISLLVNPNTIKFSDVTGRGLKSCTWFLPLLQWAFPLVQFLLLEIDKNFPVSLLLKFYLYYGGRSPQ